MRFIGGILAATVVAAALVVAGSGGTASGQDAEKPVFTVGYWQDVDSMNPTVGVTVAAYEAWNIQYADADRQGREGLLGHARASPSPGRARRTARPGPTSCART